MPPKINRIGQRFGQLTVISEAERAGKNTVWLCRCDCGTETLVMAGNLTSGGSTSCGCYRRANLVGQVFGFLTVVEESGRTAKGAIEWLCKCSCGSTVNRDSTTLRLGRTTSCGCSSRSRTHGRTHGQTGTPLYRRWQAMIQRTSNSSHPFYEYYGGRGIKVCDRWRESFEAFAADMGPSFSPDLELDRIDTNGDYEPSNCRWATRTQQARNARSNRRLTFRGHTMTVSEWAETLGLNASTIRARLNKHGWPVERALTTGVSLDALSRLD